MHKHPTHAASSAPATPGISPTTPQLATLLAEDSPLQPGFIEVAPEAYLCGGPVRKTLMRARERWPVSFHGISLSLGSEETPNLQLLQSLKSLVDEVEPFAFSDHAAWNALGAARLNAILPVPCNEGSLEHMCRNVDLAQTVLKRRICIENISACVTFTLSTLTEAEFLTRLCTSTGCGLRLDLRAVAANAHNHGFEARDYVNAMPGNAVEQFSLGGLREEAVGESSVYVADRAAPINAETWELYGFALKKFGHRAAALDWGSEEAAAEALLAQAEKAAALAQNTRLPPSKEQFYAAA